MITNSAQKFFQTYMIQLLLRNYHNSKEYICYDLVKKEKTFCKKDITYNINGYFSKIHDKIIILYKTDTLYLEIDSKIFPFNQLTIMTNDVSIKRLRGKITSIRHFIMIYNKQIVYETNYDEILPKFEFDMTACIDDEDFDFGLFLENLSRNIERQSRIFNSY
jgi:hypothetical protein